jgi:pseudomonalisin
VRARILLSAALLAGTAVPTLAGAATPAGIPLTKLANSVVPGLSHAAVAGSVPATQKIQVTVALTHPDAAGEQRMLHDVYDPKSPLFHHFLTPAQYASRFGVARSTYDQVTGWLTRDGLSVAYASPSRTQVLVEGTVAQAEKTFDVTLNNYSSNGHTFRANPTPATVPAAVGAVQGLQTASSYVLPKRNPIPTKSPANQLGPCIQGNCIGELQPADLLSVYKVPSTSHGAGVKAAIIGEGQTAPTIAALRHFETAHGTRTVPTRSVFVANDKANNDGEGEWELDSQAITGMAPDLEELDFYFSEDLTTISDAISGWVNDSASPDIANMSIGGCETLNLALGTPIVEQPLLAQGALEGKSLFVSTGDTGGSCLFSPLINLNGVENTGVPNPQWPSTSDAVVAVGGTVLYTDGKPAPTRALEYTWTHGGGGTSSFIPAPAWQTPISVIKAPCSTTYTQAPVNGVVTCRGVPDVSALSGDIMFNDFQTYDSTGANGFGVGTSLSSPLWAGMWVDIQGATSTALGLATPHIYGQANAGTLTGLFDISVGSNVQWTAQPRSAVNPTGWDYTNGLGAPVLNNLMTQIAGSTTGVGTNPPLPSPLDSEVTGSTGGTALCGGPGVINDPAGDSWLGIGSAPADLDLLQSTYALSGSNLVFTSTVSNLKATDTQEFDFQFTYATRRFQVQGTRGILGDTGGELVDLDAGLYLRPANVTATFDDATNTVTVSMPVADFNTLIAPTAAAGSGSTISGLTSFSDIVPGPGNQGTFDVPVPFDEIDGTSCGSLTL